MASSSGQWYFCQPFVKNLPLFVSAIRTHSLLNFISAISFHRCKCSSLQRLLPPLCASSMSMAQGVCEPHQSERRKCSANNIYPVYGTMRYFIFTSSVAVDARNFSTLNGCQAANGKIRAHTHFRGLLILSAQLRTSES